MEDKHSEPSEYSDVNEETLVMSSLQLPYPFDKETRQWTNGTMEWAEWAYGIVFNPDCSKKPTKVFIDIGYGPKSFRSDLQGGELLRVDWVRVNEIQTDQLDGPSDICDTTIICVECDDCDGKVAEHPAFAFDKGINVQNWEIFGSIEIHRAFRRNEILYHQRMGNLNRIGARNLLSLQMPSKVVPGWYDYTVEVQLHATNRVSGDIPTQEDVLELAQGEVYFGYNTYRADTHVLGNVKGRNGSVTVCCTQLKNAVLAKFGAILLNAKDDGNGFASIYGSITVRDADDECCEKITLFDQPRDRSVHMAIGRRIPMKATALPITLGNRLLISVDLKQRKNDTEDEIIAEGQVYLRADLNYKIDKAKKLGDITSTKDSIQLVVAFANPDGQYYILKESDIESRRMEKWDLLQGVYAP